MGKSLAGVLAQACGSTPVGVPKGTELPGPETLALAATLGREGASVARAEVMPTSAHPYFSTPAVRYVVNGESLYLFEYATEGDAESAASASRTAPTQTVQRKHSKRNGRALDTAVSHRHPAPGNEAQPRAGKNAAPRVTRSELDMVR